MTADVGFDMRPYSSGCSETKSVFARFQAAGSNLGTFGGVTNQAIQQLNVSHTWTIGTSAVNEFRFTYFRESQGQFNHPVKTNSVTNSCTGAASPFCFTGRNLRVSVQLDMDSGADAGAAYATVLQEQ